MFYALVLAVYSSLHRKTQLGLMKQMPPEQALEIAASFERETLIQSVDKVCHNLTYTAIRGLTYYPIGCL